jgi:hypothetical protein
MTHRAGGANSVDPTRQFLIATVSFSRNYGFLFSFILTSRRYQRHYLVRNLYLSQTYTHTFNNRTPDNFDVLFSALLLFWNFSSESQKKNTEQNVICNFAV